jgi:hypothetical protein
MIVKRKGHKKEHQTHLKTVPSLTSPSSESEMGRPRVRLAARDCAGDAAAEATLEDVPEAMREAVFLDTVLWLSRARLRRSRIVMPSFGTGPCWLLQVSLRTPGVQEFLE